MFTPDETLKLILKTYTSLFSTAQIHGHFPLPPGPKIIAANHTLASDAFHLPLILAETPCFLLQANLFNLPILGKLLKLAGQIPVKPNNLPSRDSLTGAQTSLTEGKTLVIFPEGELVPPGKRIPAKTGTVRLAYKTGVPIIPLGIYVSPQNTLELTIMQQGHKHTGLWQISGTCHFNFGPPWHPLSTQTGLANFHNLTKDLMENIYLLVSEIKKESTSCASHTSLNPIPR